jgi:hypothetical protein
MLLAPAQAAMQETGKNSLSRDTGMTVSPDFMFPNALSELNGANGLFQ